MMATLSITKREFRSYFDSPLAYVVICVGLALLGIFFFHWAGGYWQADQANVRQLFVWVPRGLSLLVVPVITMGLIAQEKQSGTLEMLITLPVKDHEVVLGKFLAAWGLVLVLVFATLLYPLMMFKWPWDLGNIDWRPVFSGYLGLLVYSAAAVSIGLLISALTRSQIIAFFLTFVILVVLHLMGMALSLDFLPQGARFVVSFISFDARLEPFVRGMINTRDLSYFVSLTACCLMGSVWALERRKWA